MIITGWVMPDGRCRSHKGSHLALLVELLTGGLACGAMTQKAAAENWANLVIALDPALLGPAAGFRSRVTALLEAVKAATPIPDGPGVWLPGERGDACAGDIAPAVEHQIGREQTGSMSPDA